MRIPFLSRLLEIKEEQLCYEKAKIMMLWRMLKPKDKKELEKIFSKEEFIYLWRIDYE